MIFVMLSPLLIIGFIALSIMEENVKKKTKHKENEFEQEKIKCLFLMTIMIMMQNKG